MGGSGRLHIFRVRGMTDMILRFFIPNPIPLRFSLLRLPPLFFPAGISQVAEQKASLSKYCPHLLGSYIVAASTPHASQQPTAPQLDTEPGVRGGGSASSLGGRMHEQRQGDTPAVGFHRSVQSLSHLCLVANNPVHDGIAWCTTPLAGLTGQWNCLLQQ